MHLLDAIERLLRSASFVRQAAHKQYLRFLHEQSHLLVRADTSPAAQSSNNRFRFSRTRGGLCLVDVGGSKFCTENDATPGRGGWLDLRESKWFVLILH
jgi:hypothetical protein